MDGADRPVEEPTLSKNPEPIFLPFSREHLDATVYGYERVERERTQQEAYLKQLLALLFF